MTNEEKLAELKAQLRANKDKMQDDFIDKIYNDLTFLSELAIKDDYEPTDHERFILGKILFLVKDLNKWF